MIVVHKATRVRDVVSAQRAGADAVCLLGGEAAGHPGPDQVSSLVAARLAAAERAGAPAGELNDRYGDHLFRTVVAGGDLDAGALACGQAVGLVTDVPTVAELVAAMVAGAEEAAARLDGACSAR